MGDDEELGSDYVTARTRAFEEIDAQVFPGPGRGATRSEAAASDRWGGPSPATVEAYRRMFDLVVKHGKASDEPAPPWARRLSVQCHVSNTVVASGAPTSSETSHQRKKARQEEDRHA
jgi:hypothetical protein